MTYSNLFTTDDGRVSCVSHGGSYLAVSVAGHPRRKHHRTPLEHWTRLTVEEAREFRLAGLGCETCRANQASVLAAAREARP